LKKKLSLILLITIISFFSVSSEVLGEGNVSDWSSYSTGSYKSVGGVPDFGKYSFQGYRVTIFEKNGKSATPTRAKKKDGVTEVDSIDFVMYDSMGDKGDMTVYYTTAKKRSKVDYLFNSSTESNIFNSTIVIKKLVDSSYAKNGLNIKGKRFPWLIGTAWETDHANNTNLTLKAWIENGTKTENKKTKFKDKTLILDETSFKEIVQSGGFVVPDGSVNSYYIIMEPLLLVTYKNKGYLGTAYELAKAILEDPKPNTEGRDNLSRYLKLLLPRAVYLSEKQSEDTSENGNYFIKDGNSKSFWRVEADVAKSKRYKADEIMSNYGLGIGAFWLAEIIPRNECSYNDPNDFKLNAGKGADVTKNGVKIPYCCTQFSDPNLIQDHPECGICTDSIKITILDEKEGQVITQPSNNIGVNRVNDASKRCSMAGNSNDSGDYSLTSDYHIENYFEKNIEDNMCLPITSASDTNAGDVIKINLYKNICYLKCIEEDNFDIPKNPIVTTERSHFVWPTSPSTNILFGNRYPLTGTGTTTCRIVVNTINLGKESNQNAALEECANQLENHFNSINTFDPEIHLEQTYQKSDGSKVTNDLGKLQKYNQNSICKVGTPNNINANLSCDGKSLKNELKGKITRYSLPKDRISEIRNFRFIITKTMGFKLGSELNAYINKLRIKPESSFEKNSVIVGYGNIPINVFSDTKSMSYNSTASTVGLLNLNVKKISKHFDAKNIDNMICDIEYNAHSSGSSDDQTYNYLCKATDGIANLIKDISSCKKNGLTDSQCVKEKCSQATCSLSTGHSDVSISNQDWDNIFNFYKSDPENSYSDYEAARLTQDYFDNSDICNQVPPTRYYCPESSSCKPNYDITSCVKSLVMDINGDSKSDSNDIEKLKRFVNGTESPSNDIQKKAADINGDGVIDNRDLQLFYKYYYDEKYQSTNLIEVANNKCKIIEKCDCNDKLDKFIIVRSIDLNNPFPSITGLGRLPGKNWISFDSNGNQTYVDDYIKNNRGVSTTEVYKETPLYTFNLNASTISKIKEYNNAYVNILGRKRNFEDYDLDCDNGERCISNFIHNFGDKYGYNITASKCNSALKNDFDLCTKID